MKFLIFSLLIFSLLILSCNLNIPEELPGNLYITNSFLEITIFQRGDVITVKNISDKMIINITYTVDNISYRLDTTIVNNEFKPLYIGWEKTLDIYLEIISLTFY